MSKDSFDLFAGLSSLGKKDYYWFDKLSADGQRAAAPFVIMRWLSGTSDEAQIVRLNTFVNSYVFSGALDKSSIFKALAAASTGKSFRYTWLKGPSAKAKRTAIDVICQYYEISSKEASTYSIDNDSLIQMAEELGFDKDQLTKLSKELDDGHGQGPTEKPGRKPPKRR